MYRWLALIILVAALSISGYHRRRARAATGTIPRKSEGVLFMLARAAVAVPLFGSVLVYIINPAWMAWASLPLPNWARWAGAVLGILALPGVHWVLRNLGNNVSETVLTKANHTLVQEGPYRWVRHPLYTTGLLAFFALGLMIASAVTLGFALLAFLAVRLFVIPREEAALQSRFGQTYSDYMAHTGALIPRLGA